MFYIRWQRCELASDVVPKLLGSGWVGKGGSRVELNRWHPGLQIPVGQKAVNSAEIHESCAGYWLYHWWNLLSLSAELSLSHSHSSWLLLIGLAFLFFFIHSYLYISQLQESGWGRTKVGPFCGAPKAGETGCLPFFSFSSEENSSYLESSLLVLNKISLGDGTMQAK